MASRDQRMKASDVFREANFLFSTKTSFDEAFPEIEDIVVEVVEVGEGVGRWSDEERARIYSKSHLPGEYIDCSNSRCYNGGVSIGSIIRAMLRKHDTDHQVSKMCQGYEGSPKGRRRYRSCRNHFDVKVSIKYKE